MPSYLRPYALPVVRRFSQDNIPPLLVQAAVGIADTATAAISIALPDGFEPNTPADTLTFLQSQLDTLD